MMQINWHKQGPGKWETKIDSFIRLRAYKGYGANWFWKIIFKNSIISQDESKTGKSARLDCELAAKLIADRFSAMVEPKTQYLATIVIIHKRGRIETLPGIFDCRTDASAWVRKLLYARGVGLTKCNRFQPCGSRKWILEDVRTPPRYKATIENISISR